MKRFGVIYKIIEKKTGFSYVGKTTRTSTERFNDHYWKTSSKMYIDLALRKKGRDAFLLEELFIAFDEDSLNKAEAELVKTHNTLYPNGYNLKDGGKGNVSHTERAKKRISLAVRKAIKEGRFKGNKGNNHSLETRESISKHFSKDSIVAINLKTGDVSFFERAFQLVDKGFHKSNVVSICRRRHNRKICKGYTFLYANDYANQIGSIATKEAIHEQRIDPETIKKLMEYNGSKSPHPL
jgi:group I intron endonuclease